jgi:glycosyltransferase involved in cell wall biosynthesis
MNVTLLTTGLGWGGTERYVVDLAETLGRFGVQVRVVADKPPLNRLERLDAAGIETIILGPRYLSNRESYTKRLTGVLQYGRTDVVHVNAWERGSWIATVVSKVNLPALRTEHNTQPRIRIRDILGVNRRPFSWYQQVLQSVRFPMPAISISTRSLENLRHRTLGLVKSVRIYNGVKVPALPRGPKQGGENEKRVIWVGSMTERKRPLLAIEAIERAAALRPGISLVMIGDGPLLSEMRRRAKAVRFAKIEFRGNIRDVVGEMDRGDVFLQTSSNEGLSYAVLEAMSTALPVLGTDIGATSEAVLDGATGCLFGSQETASEISRRLVSMLDQPDVLDTMGAKGFERCREVFSLDRMVQETREIYDLTTASYSTRNSERDGTNRNSSRRRPAWSKQS